MAGNGTTRPAQQTRSAAKSARHASIAGPSPLSRPAAAVGEPRTGLEGQQSGRTDSVPTTTALTTGAGGEPSSTVAPAATTTQVRDAAAELDAMEIDEPHADGVAPDGDADAPRVDDAPPSDGDRGNANNDGADDDDFEEFANETVTRRELAGFSAKWQRLMSQCFQTAAGTALAGSEGAGQSNGRKRKQNKQQGRDIGATSKRSKNGGAQGPSFEKLAKEYNRCKKCGFHPGPSAAALKEHEDACDGGEKGSFNRRMNVVRKLVLDGKSDQVNNFGKSDAKAKK